MELLQKQFGPVNADISVDASALNVSVKVPFMALLDAAAAKAKVAIPGTIDDALIDVFMAALKAELSK